MNPFTERSRITEPRHFAGRWRELSLIFERLEQRRPVLIVGPPRIGKSSLLTHVAQAAAAAMDEWELEALYVDLAVLPDAATCYELVVQALGGAGDTHAALEVALLDAEGPVLLCLDNVEAALAADWGALLLERLARTARSSAARSGGLALPGALDLLLVAAVRSPAPLLSEPFVAITLGAFAPSEIRLVVDAYLDDTGVAFSPAELRDLAYLSVGHPAYLQRAAFHLFTARTQPGYDWRAAYLDEARERPEPGAPLPPAVFEGEPAEHPLASTYGEPGAAEADRPAAPRLEGVGGLAGLLLALVAALLVAQFSGNWLLAAGALVAGIALVVAIERRRHSEK